jgi:ferredoxin-thioredoxin reductase catalytic subunit
MLIEGEEEEEEDILCPCKSAFIATCGEKKVLLQVVGR